jgi:DNA-binding Xre family transcriptional regulator
MKGLKKQVDKSKYTLTQLGQILRPDTKKQFAYQMMNRMVTEGKKKAPLIRIDDLRKLKELLGCSYEDIIDEPKE